jgi:hypothetical protein
MVTVHVPVPLHAPPQPPKTDPVVGEAVRVTTVPETSVSEQSEPQLMPLGLLVTAPEPVPDLETLSVYEVGVGVGVEATLNVAVIVIGAFPVVVHELVPEQPPPLQPAKTDPLAAAADSVTTRPAV